MRVIENGNIEIMKGSKVQRSLPLAGPLPLPCTCRDLCPDAALGLQRLCVENFLCLCLFFLPWS